MSWACARNCCQAAAWVAGRGWCRGVRARRWGRRRGARSSSAGVGGGARQAAGGSPRARGVGRPLLDQFPRPFAAAEDTGDRAVVKAFDELEDDHLPLLLRQVLEGELYLSAVEGAFGEGLGVYLQAGGGLRGVTLSAPPAAAVEVYQLV